MLPCHGQGPDANSDHFNNRRGKETFFPLAGKFMELWWWARLGLCIALELGFGD